MSYIVYDLEASGLSESICDIQQCSILVFDDDHTLIRAENLYFYKKNMHFSQEAYEINHISLEFLEQYEDMFEENIVKMYALLNRARVVGYNNLEYDDPFVTTWLRRNGMSSFAIGASRDVMQIFKPIYKRSAIALVKLIPFVAEHGILDLSDEIVGSVASMWFGEDANGAHDARWDATATALLVQHAFRTGLASFNVVPKTTLILDEGDNALDSDDLKEVNTSMNFMETHKVLLTLTAGDKVNHVTVNASGVIAEVTDQLSIDAFTLAKQCLPIPMKWNKNEKVFKVDLPDDNIKLSFDMNKKELILDNGYGKFNVLTNEMFSAFQDICKNIKGETEDEDSDSDSQPSPRSQSPPSEESVRKLFEQCESLSELNARRAQVASNGEISVIVINNAYNRRRAELINTQQNYKKVTPIPLQIESRDPVSSLPLGGYSTKKNTISITSGGIMF